MYLWKIVLIALINVGGPSSLCPANAVLYKKASWALIIAECTIRHGGKECPSLVSTSGSCLDFLPWLPSGVGCELKQTLSLLSYLWSAAAAERKQNRLLAIPLEALSPPCWDLTLFLVGACETTQRAEREEKQEWALWPSAGTSICTVAPPHWILLDTSQRHAQEHSDKEKWVPWVSSSMTWTDLSLEMKYPYLLSSWLCQASYHTSGNKAF